jgi:hypothetical protein
MPWLPRQGIPRAARAGGKIPHLPRNPRCQPQFYFRARSGVVSAVSFSGRPTMSQHRSWRRDQAIARADLEPGDEQCGDYSRERLGTMSADFIAKVERALTAERKERERTERRPRRR